MKNTKEYLVVIQGTELHKKFEDFLDEHKADTKDWDKDGVLSWIKYEAVKTKVYILDDEKV